MINPNLDIEALARSFKVDNRLMIEDFLLPDVAERMLDACLTSVPFDMQYVLDDKYQSMSQEEASRYSPQEQQAINNRIFAAASRGVGFLYDGYLKSRVKSSLENILDEKLSFLHDVFTYIGSEDVLSPSRQITACEEITGAEPQFTRFTPGHFLTRHRDIVGGRQRRIAFVLGLTKRWHPDWGGLLQFYKEDGTPRDAWTPRFNVLSIFDVTHIHAVTYVTPFATTPRISLTGWFVARG
jgi:Rps23 Pro-64 3,4-dihydroxylase Tpa1-like proline 4-hydroxylase